MSSAYAPSAKSLAKEHVRILSDAAINVLAELCDGDPDGMWVTWTLVNEEVRRLIRPGFGAQEVQRGD